MRSVAALSYRVLHKSEQSFSGFVRSLGGRPPGSPYSGNALVMFAPHGAALAILLCPPAYATPDHERVAWLRPPVRRRRMGRRRVALPPPRRLPDPEGPT